MLYTVHTVRHAVNHLQVTIHITDKSKSGFTLKMHGYGEGGQHRAKKKQHTTRVLSSVQAIYTCPRSQCDGQVSSVHTVAIKINFPFHSRKISIVFYAISAHLINYKRKSLLKHVSTTCVKSRS